MTTPIPFSDHLRSERARIGLTLDTCADALDVSRRCVAKWEAGATPLDITAEGALARLAKLPDKPAKA